MIQPYSDASTFDGVAVMKLKHPISLPQEFNQFTNSSISLLFNFDLQ